LEHYNGQSIAKHHQQQPAWGFYSFENVNSENAALALLN
jgi:hypothetical protein